MKRALVLGIALLLAGCGGGSSGVAPTQPSGGTTATKAQTQSGVVTLDIPTRTTGPSSQVRYPQFVSPNASSVAIAVNGGAAQNFDVSATSTLCVTVSGNRTCSLNVGAPVGSDTFAITIYQGANETGSVLATSTSTNTVVAGTPFSFTVAMNATIGTITLQLTGANSGTNCPDNIPNYNAIFEGCSGSGIVTATVTDPSGATVTGNAPYAAPIQLTGTNDPSLTLSPSQITAPGGAATASYSGAPFGPSITNFIQINASAGGQFAGLSYPVVRQYLYVANSNAPFGTTPTGGGNVAVYPFGAGAGTAPVRTLSGANTQLSNPVQVLLDQNDELYVLDNGPYTTNSNPVVLVFAPGANGNVAPIRSISGFTAIDANRACESMTFDPTKTKLFVLCDDLAAHVFPASGNATAASLQLYSLNDDSWEFPIGLAFDNVGNMWATDAALGVISEYNGAALPTSGLYTIIGPTNVLQAPASFPNTVDPLIAVFDQSGTLYSSIVYVNATAGANDAQNEIGIWKSSLIPCNRCAPTAYLNGGAFATHAPAGIALDAAGNLYSSNPFQNQVQVFTAASVAAASSATNPAQLHTITTGSSPGSPTGIFVGP